MVAVYGGEGSTSEGDWHEMMNFAGIHSLPLICIIENNRYAISVADTEQVGGRIVDRAKGYGVTGVEVDGNDPLAVYGVVREAAERARSGGGATLVEAQTYRYYAHTSDDDDRLYRTREEVDLWRRHDPLAVLKQYLIETRLLSERDEEAMESSIAEELAAAVTEAEAAPEPDDPYSHVYANPIVPETPSTEPEPEPEGESVNLITAINRTLHEILEAHPETVVFGEDVADPKGGVFKATQGLSARFGANRCFNTPIAESLIAGLAVGMAAAGKTPLAELQFADYVHPAFDQIVSEIARIHYRSNGRWRMPLVLRTPFGGGIHGALYHSQSIEAYYSHVPGLKVVVPSTPADAKGLLWSAVEDPDPVFYMEPKKLYRLGRYPFPEGEWKVPLGKAAVRRAGTDAHSADLRRDDALLARGSDRARRRGNRHRGDRPALASSARLAHHRGLGAEDLAGPHRPRGQRVRRVRGRACRTTRGQGVRVARRPGAPLLRPRGSQLPLRPSHGGHDLPQHRGDRHPGQGTGRVVRAVSLRPPQGGRDPLRSSGEGGCRAPNGARPRGFRTLGVNQPPSPDASGVGYSPRRGEREVPTPRSGTGILPITSH